MARIYSFSLTAIMAIWFCNGIRYSKCCNRLSISRRSNVNRRIGIAIAKQASHIISNNKFIYCKKPQLSLLCLSNIHKYHFDHWTAVEVICTQVSLEPMKTKTKTLWRKATQTNANISEESKLFRMPNIFRNWFCFTAGVIVYKSPFDIFYKFYFRCNCELNQLHSIEFFFCSEAVTGQ